MTMDLPTPTPSDHSPDSPTLSMPSLNPESSKSEALDDPLLSPLFVFPDPDTSTSSSSGSSSQNGDSPPNDWALPGAMWSQFSDSKAESLDELGSLSMGLNFPPGLAQDSWSTMDMDTDMTAFIPDPPQHMSVDPNALHFPSADLAQGSFNHMFQFTLSQPGNAPFQLPTPTPGSTSSRSASPTVPKTNHAADAGVNPSDLSLFTQLGQKARDAAGIMLAVPVQPGSRDTAPTTPGSPISTDSQVPPPKVPIPRLRPSTGVPQKSPPAGATSPAPASTQPTPAAASPLASTEESTAVPATTKTGRPKTSHTTIERRYRTNLNARILALRRAVPALRILEKNTAHQTQGKGLTGASATKWDFNDVVNERGYVDGVKAAKKNSKGIVLGKAVEYIKALKRRETRLKRESDGLRALVAGLVGGPELLREWEKEWRARFGGEEADEVDEDADDGDDADADDDEGESDADDDRAKKRARVEKKERKPAPAEKEREKRKRGRPRKNPAPDVPALILQPPAVERQQQQPSKYLLAAFLLFSFASPNANVPAPAPSYEGAVLTSGPVLVDAPGWTAMQVIHVLVSVLFLASFLPRRLTRRLPFPDALLFGSGAVKQLQRVSREAVIAGALAAGDERALRGVMGADGGVWGVVRAGLGRAVRVRGKSDVVTRNDETVLRGWRRLGHIEVMRGTDSPLLTRVQTYLSLSARLPAFAASPSDNITLALLAHSFAASTAAERWDAARRAESKSSVEALVLNMDIVDATHLATTAPPSSCADASPVQRIAAHVIIAHAKTRAANTFISAVSGARIVDLDDASASAEPCAAEQAARALSGALGALVGLLDKAQRCSAQDVLVMLPEEDTAEDTPLADVRALVRATLLYRCVFPSTDAASTHVPSPPPSPTHERKSIAALHLALRRALASTAFDADAETDEARDRVVDMLSARGGRLGWGGMY